MNLYLTSFAVVAILIVWWIPKRQTSNLRLEAKDRLTLENELRKTIAQIVGGAAILAGLYFTWQQLQASRRSLEIAQEAQTTERFTRAVDQIGNQQLQVRVGGIYALGEISKDPSYDRRWTVISVLAAFLRDRASWRPGPPKIPLPEDIQAAVSVIAARDSRGATYDATIHHVIDLTGTDLRRALLRAANLQAVELTRVHLEGADLRGASLAGVVMTGAHLDEALLDDSDLSAADLRGTELRGTSLSGANLRRAHLEGVDLSSVKGLSSKQVSEILKNSETVIPSVFTGQVKSN